MPPRRDPAARTVPPSPPMRIQQDIAAIAVLKVAAVALTLWLLARAWSALLLLLFSLMLVATFQPLVRWLERRLTPRSAILAVVAGLMVLLGLLIVLIVPPLLRQATNLINNLPVYSLSVVDILHETGVPIDPAQVSQGLTETISALVPRLIAVFASMFRSFVGLIMVLVLTVYILVDGPQVSSALIRLLPRRERQPTSKVLAEIAGSVGNYVRGQIVLSVLAGLFSYALLTALQVPEALALASLMAVADAIPLIGAVIGTIPAVLVALTRSDATAIGVAVGYLLYQQFENHLLMPRVYNRIMRLPPSVILISILVGVTLMGLPGAILALPVAAAVPLILRFVGEWRDRQAEMNSH
jgi:predicted PurR-regulated permease PerM